MQKLKMKLILPLMILISGCNEFPVITPQKRCVNVLLEEVVINDISYRSGYCRCHLYEWSRDRIGRIGDSTNFPMSKCDKLIGFEPDTYANVWTYWESIRLWLKRQKSPKHSSARYSHEEN
jgi:hypothetical protein